MNISFPLWYHIFPFCAKFHLFSSHKKLPSMSGAEVYEKEIIFWVDSFGQKVVY